MSAFPATFALGFLAVLGSMICVAVGVLFGMLWVGRGTTVDVADDVSPRFVLSDKQDPVSLGTADDES